MTVKFLVGLGHMAWMIAGPRLAKSTEWEPTKLTSSASSVCGSSFFSSASVSFEEVLLLSTLFLFFPYETFPSVASSEFDNTTMCYHKTISFP